MFTRLFYAGSVRFPAASRPRPVYCRLFCSSVSDGSTDPFSSIVKVFVAKSTPNFFLPWQNKSIKESIGSGFCIEGRRIITNAHVVADQKYVQLKKLGDPTKYTSRVVSVDHQCDLAMLELDSEEFWQGENPMQALDFGEIPQLQDVVTVIGYPIGGDNISVTQGVVSRVEPQLYVHGSTHLLAIQIDAAINPGNSGGPALKDGKVVGVAFQNLNGASNIGFIIPTPIIHHFLKDSKDNANKPLGFCHLGVSCQPTENACLQKHMHISPENKHMGVLVNRIHPFSAAAHHLQVKDIILSLDNHSIACDGTVYFRERERVSYSYLMSSKHAGDRIKVELLRDGRVLTKTLTMQPVPPLVPAHQWDTSPSYFIFAGLTFINLTRTFLQEYANEVNRDYPQWERDAPRHLVELAQHALPSQEGEEIVILSQVLASEVNHGYQQMLDAVVTTVNGEKVRNLKHMKDLVMAAVAHYQAQVAANTAAAAAADDDAALSSPPIPPLFPSPSPPSRSNSNSNSNNSSSNLKYPVIDGISEEELRILYVAQTRARFTLEVNELSKHVCNPEKQLVVFQGCCPRCQKQPDTENAAITLRRGFTEIQSSVCRTSEGVATQANHQNFQQQQELQQDAKERKMTSITAASTRSSVAEASNPFSDNDSDGEVQVSSSSSSPSSSFPSALQFSSASYFSDDQLEASAFHNALPTVPAKSSDVNSEVFGDELIQYGEIDTLLPILELSRSMSYDNNPFDLSRSNSFREEIDTDWISVRDSINPENQDEQNHQHPASNGDLESNTMDFMMSNTSGSSESDDDKPIVKKRKKKGKNSSQNPAKAQKTKKENYEGSDAAGRKEDPIKIEVSDSDESEPKREIIKIESD